MASEKRLIDPTEYKSFLERYIKGLYEVDAPMIAGAVERCLYKLEAQPTVDAVEVVHGRWEEIGAADYQCSRCGFRFSSADPIAMFQYCRCGAKMDGDVNGRKNRVYSR